jgi:hypothetical protein
MVADRAPKRARVTEPEKALEKVPENIRPPELRLLY